jgi:hypothetical protein
VWTSKAKRTGPPTLLVVALLVLLALCLPSVRRALAKALPEILSRTSGLKVPGFEVTLTAVTGAAAGPIKQLMSSKDDWDGDDSEEGWARSPSVSTDPRFAEASIEKLSDRLRQRIDWIWANVPGLGTRPEADAEAVDRLRGRDLMPTAVAEVLHTLAIIELDQVADTRARDQRLLQRFLAQADAAVGQSRQVAFDLYVREILRGHGYVLVDWKPQPPRRWPDFLAYGYGREDKASDETFWISVRLAEVAESALYKGTVRRLNSARSRSEVPGGINARPLIVVPDKSATALTTQGVVEGVRLAELTERVV